MVMTPFDIINALIAASLTLMILSLLWGENLAFRFAEHTFIGVATGYLMVLGINSIINSGVTPLMLGSYLLIIPIILGFLLYARFVKRTQWISRWPIAIYAGVGTGLGASSAIGPMIVQQVIATAKPLYVGGDILQTVNNWLILVIVIGTLAYFYYSSEHKGVLGSWARIGRYGIMVAMGAAYANTALGRFSLLIGRVQFLVTYPAYYVFAAGAVFLVSFLLYKASRRTRSQSPKR